MTPEQQESLLRISDALHQLAQEFRLIQDSLLRKAAERKALAISSENRDPSPKVVFDPAHGGRMFIQYQEKDNDAR